MQDRCSHDRVVPVQNLREFFRESIDEAMSKQRVDVDPHATHYVVNLLTLFSRSEELYEDHGDNYGLKPLALMMADAAEARSLSERSFSLQRIGDVALFIAGFFADSLADKAVDVDYYICMGGTAYGSLSEEIRGTVRGRAFASIYRELAAKFQVLVDVLHEVRDGTRNESDIDLLRTYEIWLKTGSRRAAALLKQNRVVPISSARDPRKH
ncbi:MAG: hypothetical protein OEW35_13500 [Gammaproteobacteria bacterium]|nr:hypothetical protein [Gammaproteobacteria bacterium]MDH5311585.1 hypothetical protein [Gammaproteobacteria bacterium]